MIATLTDIRAVEACALDDCSINALNNGKNGAEDMCAEFDAWCAEQGLEPIYDLRTIWTLGARAAAVANASECWHAHGLLDEAERNHPFHTCHYREKPMCESTASTDTHQPLAASSVSTRRTWYAVVGGEGSALIPRNLTESHAEARARAITQNADFPSIGPWHVVVLTENLHVMQDADAGVGIGDAEYMMGGMSS